MKKKTLILTFDLPNATTWQVKAKHDQLKDWLTVNKILKDHEDLIIMQAPGQTKLYWLEGTAENVKELEEIKDRITPILEVVLEVKASKSLINPLEKSLQDLRIQRAKRLKI